MPDHPFGYVDKLPEPIRHQFVWLCQEVANLSMKWQFYCKLLGNEKNANVVRISSPYAASIIEESLRIDMTMSICRLADPDKTGKYENL